jgi:PAS domain-containing protein
LPHSSGRPSAYRYGNFQVIRRGFWAHEYRFKCKDGKYRWLADHFSIIKDKSGIVRFRAGIVRDITEKKQVEETLVRSENKFRTLAENSPDLIARFDRQKRHIICKSCQCRALWLFSRRNHWKKPMVIWEWTLSWLNYGKSTMKTFLPPEVPEVMEFHYTSPQGKKYYFNTQVVPEFIDGEVVSVLAISHDITDIKEAEAKLKDTLDNLENLVKERTVELEEAYKLLKEREESLAEAQKMAHIGSWEWDIAADKAYWSEEMYRIFGRDPQKSAPSLDEYLSYIHPTTLTITVKSMIIQVMYVLLDLILELF